MSPVDDTDCSSPHPDPENLQELLASAHARLVHAPERWDGSKVALVTTIGSFDLRLLELTRSASSMPPLWVEVCDTRSKRTIDSIGRRTFQDLATAASWLISSAERIGGAASCGRSP